MSQTTEKFDLPDFSRLSGIHTVKPAAQGNWYALDERLFKKRVERLAELAGIVDFTKRACPDEEQRARLAQAVALIHGVAVHYDSLHGWGLYETERVETAEVES